MNALEKLKEICDKATPGPWAADQATPEGRLFTVNDRLACSVCGNAYKDDAEFIATARQAMPALIALVEAYREHHLLAPDCICADEDRRELAIKAYDDAWERAEQACAKIEESLR